MSDFLDTMAEASARRAWQAKSAATRNGLRSRTVSAPPPRPLELGESGFDVIAEAKLASPAQGALIEGDDDTTVVELAADFVEHGAVAISVLTEETQFRGSLDHLEAVSAAVRAPVMRKDFLVDPIQVDEARAAGASGVLLIARLLPGALLTEMTDRALALGLFVLVEVFDRSDLETAAVVFDREVLVGVNSRDLATLDVDRTRLRALAPHLPDGLPAVAESGIRSERDAVAICGLGYRLALVGSSLVTANRPGPALAELVAAGRSVLTGSR
ncbi:MAG TPA: indole-3-glycerol-phosphate synthase [Acidimicrobiia bacterium]|nr:indole-3-glycerol-phosphate synthase [Acidimicrobiia bacterium]